MGLIDSLMGQTVSVIEWKDPSPDLLFWRWDGGNDEIKRASKLIINPGQSALFVYEGEVKAIHTQPGLFELRTANIPFWTTLTKIMQGFQSEHKANIFFIRTTELLNQKWGTKAPVKYEDPKYKFPVGLRANGNFSFRIINLSEFFHNIASVRHAYAVSEIRVAIVDRILTPLTDLFAESGFSYAEIDKNRVELSALLRQKLSDDFKTLGFELTDFRIENTDFDEDTKKRIDKISDKIADAHAIRALGDIDPTSMKNFAAVEQLSALKTAAGNPGSGANVVVGMGAGAAMGQMFGNPGAPVAPPPPATASTVACGSCQGAMEEKAKFCPNCGKPNPRQAVVICVSCKKNIQMGVKFCPECGSSQQSKCPDCLIEVASGTKFCPGCGKKLV
jgi:membrane protease subunit (stomatin/prohibitin family)